MPPLSAIRAANAAAFSSSHPPVAVFVGGTSGIGQAMAEAFGRLTKGNAQIIIVGRNRTAADSIIAKLPQSSSPTLPNKFVQCDATLMKNVHAASSEILANHPKINFLVMSPGFMTTKGRDETEEGIDRKLAVHYYARWAFINDLMPALQKAGEDGEDAKVFSVLGAGKGAEIDVEDLGLKKTYSVSNAGLAAPTYNDLMMEAFAERHPDLTFIHAYPGFVRTNILSASNTPLLKASSGILNFLTYPLSTPAEDCAEYMWHALLNHSKGAFRTGSKGENLEMKNQFGTEEQRKKLWDHTVQATTV